MLKYHAILHTLAPLDRPVQGFFTDPARAEEWAKLVLANRSPGSSVSVTELIEAPLATYTKNPDGTLTFRMYTGAPQ